MSVTAVILTSTDEAKFQSEKPPHLHTLAGQHIINYAVDLAYQLTQTAPFVVVTTEMTDQIELATNERGIIVKSNASGNYFSVTAQILNTIENEVNDFLILHADQPLLQKVSLQNLIACHRNQTQGITFLKNHATAKKDSQSENPDNICDQHNLLTQFLPCVISTRTLTSACFQNILQRPPSELTVESVMKTADENDFSVWMQTPTQKSDLLMIHTRREYEKAHKIMRKRINNGHMDSGVTFIDAATTYIDYNVSIGRDTTIYPNTTITGPTNIGENCQIGPNTIINQCDIGDRCRVLSSVLESAVMEHDSDIGPFSHLRKGAHICAHAHIGNYGEIKNSTLGMGAKMGHFSYLGDAIVGAHSNIGAGTITCNFDGTEKHATEIGDNVFIGSGTLIVAPIEIGDDAKTGAGSVVTHDVKPHTLVYGVPAREKPDKKSSKKT